MQLSWGNCFSSVYCFCNLQPPFTVLSSTHNDSTLELKNVQVVCTQRNVGSDGQVCPPCFFVCIFKIFFLSLYHQQNDSLFLSVCPTSTVSSTVQVEPPWNRGPPYLRTRHSKYTRMLSESCLPEYLYCMKSD